MKMKNLYLLIIAILYLTSCDKETVEIDKNETPLELTYKTENVTCKSKGKAYLFVEGGVPPYSFKWSNGANNDTVNNLDIGDYSIIIEDAVGNTKIDTITINENEPILIEGTVKIVDIETLVSGGVKPYQYHWTTSDTTANIYNCNQDSVSLTITDSIGCSATKTFYFSPDGIYLVNENLPYQLDKDNAFSPALVYGNNFVGESRDGFFFLDRYLKNDVKYLILEKINGTVNYYSTNNLTTVSNTSNPDEYSGGYYTSQTQSTQDYFYISNLELLRVYLDKQSNEINIIPLINWSVIGSCFEGGWSNEYLLNKSDEWSWKIDTVNIANGEFKFRYGNGFFIERETYRIPTIFGINQSSNNLSAENPAYEINTEGRYEIELLYTEKQYTMNLKWLSELPEDNPSNHTWSLYGNAFLKPDGTQAMWDYYLNFSYKRKEGEYFLFEIENLKLLQDGSFVIAMDSELSTNYGFNDLVIEGDTENFKLSSTGHPIQVIAEKNYNIILKLNEDLTERKIEFVLI